MKKRLWEWLKHLFVESTFTDWVVALFTVVLGFVAYQQFVITDRQLEVMRTDERAWVEAHIAEPPPDSHPERPLMAVGSPIVVPMTIKNVGKTPARGVTVLTWVVAEPALVPVPLQCIYEPEDCPAIKRKFGILLPNDVVPGTGYRTDRDLGQVVATSEEAMGYQNYTVYTAVFGVITYRDVFGMSHWTHFCAWHAKPAPQGLRASYNTEACAEFNDAGDDPH
jgi:hypothetical protein